MSIMPTNSLPPQLSFPSLQPAELMFSTLRIHSVTDNGQVIDLAKSGKADGTKILSWGQKKPTAKNQVWKLVPV